MTYLIWSHEHGAWWGPGQRGYTKNWRDAGVYDRNTAMRICRDALKGVHYPMPPNEVPVLLDDVRELHL